MQPDLALGSGLFELKRDLVLSKKRLAQGENRQGSEGTGLSQRFHNLIFERNPIRISVKINRDGSAAPTPRLEGPNSRRNGALFPMDPSRKHPSLPCPPFTREEGALHRSGVEVALPELRSSGAPLWVVSRRLSRRRQPRRTSFGWRMQRLELSSHRSTRRELPEEWRVIGVHFSHVVEPPVLRRLRLQIPHKDSYLPLEKRSQAAWLSRRPIDPARLQAWFATTRSTCFELPEMSSSWPPLHFQAPALDRGPAGISPKDCR